MKETDLDGASLISGPENSAQNPLDFSVFCFSACPIGVFMVLELRLGTLTQKPTEYR